MNSNLVNQVYETYDYDAFTFSKDNRNITENSKLHAEIKENGILVPVLVNEKFEVIDGQHRIEYAKKADKPVVYIILQGAGKKEIISINTTSRQWTLMDYIESYAGEGLQEYEKLWFLSKRYDIRIGALCSLAFNSTDGYRPADRVKARQLKFANYDFLVKFLNYYQDLIDKTPLESSQSLVLSLYTIYRVKKFDEKRIYDKAGLIVENLKGVTKQNQTTRILLEAYNHRLREGSKKEIKYHVNSRGNVEYFDELKDEVKQNMNDDEDSKEVG